MGNPEHVGDEEVLELKVSDVRNMTDECLSKEIFALYFCLDAVMGAKRCSQLIQIMDGLTEEGITVVRAEQKVVQ